MKLHLQRFKKDGGVFVSTTPANCYEATEFNANPSMMSAIQNAGIGGNVFVVRSIKKQGMANVISMHVVATNLECIRIVRDIGARWADPLTDKEIAKMLEQFNRNPFGQHSVQSFPAGRDGWSPADTEFVSFFAATVR